MGADSKGSTAAEPLMNSSGREAVMPAGSSGTGRGAVDIALAVSGDVGCSGGQVARCTVAVLKAYLRDAGLSTTGLKAELVDREQVGLAGGMHWMIGS